MPEALKPFKPFEHFQVLITPGVGDKVQPARVHDCLHEHLHGNWGLLDDEDKAHNQRTLEEGPPGMLMSVWLIDPEVTDLPSNRFWIITDQRAKVTTALLSDEY